MALLSWVMAMVMQHNEVVFEKTACHATFNAGTKDGKIVCGEFTKTNAESVEFIANIMLKNPPICKVTKGTLTDKIVVSCEYK